MISWLLREPADQFPHCFCRHHKFHYNDKVAPLIWLEKSELIQNSQIKKNLKCINKTGLLITGLLISLFTCNYFFFKFSTKSYVVGTQKKCLNEMIFLSSQNRCYNRYIRKYSQYYAQKCYLSVLCKSMYAY